MTFLHATRQRLAACIAILAVLMLFVAPVVSKELMQHSMPMSGMTTLSEMDSNVPSPASPDENGTGQMHHHHAHAAGHSPPPEKKPAALPSMMGHIMVEGDLVCGYCDLLIHVPLIIWVFAPFIWLIWRIQQTPAAAMTSAPLLSARYRTHHPRAPPPLFCSV